MYARIHFSVIIHNSTKKKTFAYNYTVKNIRISTDILWQVFHILTFGSVNRRNNEAWAHTAMCRSIVLKLVTSKVP